MLKVSLASKIKRRGTKTMSPSKKFIKPTRTRLSGNTAFGKHTVWMSFALPVIALTEPDSELTNQCQARSAEKRRTGNCGLPLLKMTTTSNIYTNIIIKGSRSAQRKPRTLFL
jgi:hypothetical protein